MYKVKVKLRYDTDISLRNENGDIESHQVLFAKMELVGSNYNFDMIVITSNKIGKKSYSVFQRKVLKILNNTSCIRKIIKGEFKMKFKTIKDNEKYKLQIQEQKNNLEDENIQKKISKLNLEFEFTEKELK